MPRKKDKDKRKKILDAAIRVFARQGFHDSKIGDVAREAEVAHGTVYLYFKSKDDLLISIFQETLSDLIEYIKSEVKKESDAESKIRKMISIQIEMIEANADLTQLMLVEFPRTGRFFDNITVDLLSVYINMIADVLKEGKESGIFEYRINADIAATMIYAGIQGIATRWILDEMRYSLSVMADDISELLLGGIKSSSISQERRCRKMAITIGDIKYTPDPMVAGGKVKAAVKVTSDEGVASVKLYTPDYRTLEAYDDGTHGDDTAEDGIYTLVTDVPYDAERGTYDVTLVVTDKKGNVSRNYMQVRVG